MRNLLFLLLLVTGAISEADASSRAAAAADRPTNSTVTVRIYDTGVLPLPRRTPPLAVAAEILKTAGLDVSWLACGTMLAGVDDNPCTAPVSPDELVVRFAELPVPADHSGPFQLGFSVIDSGAHAGTFATIYVDRARRFARDSGDRADNVIGRAIVHEIGHLLLGTNNHAATGIMRANWSRKAVQRERDWLFSPGDAMTMRETIRLRLQQTTVASRSSAFSPANH